MAAPVIAWPDRPDADVRIREVCEFVYEGLRGDPVTEVSYGHRFPGEEHEELLGLLQNAGIVRVFRGVVSFTQRGGAAYHRQCIPELTLGRGFVVRRYGRAVVHLLVQGYEDVEPVGGTGFFAASFPGWIVTARHNVLRRRVVRVDDCDGNALAGAIEDVRMGPEKLDLALIACGAPQNVIPMPIEWDERPDDFEPVLAFGYPRIPLHQPALYQTEGRIQARPVDIFGRESIVLSNDIVPGCSGGPVLNEWVRVIGVISSEGRSRQVEAED